MATTSASSVAMHDAEHLLSHPHLLGEVHARACALLGDAVRDRAEAMLPPRTAHSAVTMPAATAGLHSPHAHHPALSALTSSPLSLPSSVSLGAGLLAPTSSVLQAASAESSARATRGAKLWWERRRARVCGGASAAMDAAASSAAVTPAVPASCHALDRSVGLPFPLSGSAFLHRLSSLLSAGHTSIPDSIDVLVRLLEEDAAHSAVEAEAGQALPAPTSSLSDPALFSAPLPALPFQTAYVDYLIYLFARLDSAAAEARGAGAAARVQFTDELEQVERQRAAAWNQSNNSSKADAVSIGAYSSPVYGCLSFLQAALSLHLSREAPLDLNSSRGAFVALLLEHEVMAQLLAQWLAHRENLDEDDVQVFARLLPQTATLEGQLAQHAKDLANPFYHAPLHANFRLHYTAALTPANNSAPHALQVRNAGAPVPIPVGGALQRAALHARDLFLTAHDVHALLAHSFAHTIHDHLCPRATAAAAAGNSSVSGPIRTIQKQQLPQQRASTPSALPAFSAQLDLLHQRLVHPPAIPSTPHARIHVPACSPSAPLGPCSPAAAAAASPLARARSREGPVSFSAGVQDPYSASAHAALNAQAMERPSSRHEAFSFRRGGGGSEGSGEGAAVLAAAVMQHRIDRERAEATLASTAAATAASALANLPASASRPASSPSSAGPALFGESPFAARGNFVPRATLSSRAAGERSDSPTRAAVQSLQQQQMEQESKEQPEEAGSNVPALLAARRASQANAIATATAAAAASRRVPQPSTVPRPASASAAAGGGVRVHNHMLSPHPARGFVLRLHDSALPSKLLVVAVPEQRAPAPPNPHVHPPTEEAAAAKAARLSAARGGRKVRKASAAAYAPVVTSSLQPEMAARMHTGFERTFIPDLLTDRRLDLPAPEAAAAGAEDGQQQDSPAHAVRPHTAQALMSQAYTSFFHSPHARALQSALTGVVAPPQSSAPTVAAAVPQSTLASLAATSRAPVDDLLGVHARSGAGQHAALTSRSRHWHKQHRLKTELARLALVAQYAVARPVPGSAPSTSRVAAVAAGGWMHAPSPAAIRERLGSTSLAPPRAAPPPALSDLPRAPQLEHPFGKEAASVSRVPQHGLLVSAAADASDAHSQSQPDPFANPADWMRSAGADERPKASVPSSSSVRARGLAARPSPRDDDSLLVGFEAESKEQPSFSVSALGIAHDLSALTAHVRSDSLQGAETDSQPMLSGSSDPSLCTPVPTVIFRAGEHVHPSGCALESTPQRPTSSAIPATVVAAGGPASRSDDATNAKPIAGMSAFIEGIKSRDGLEAAAAMQQARALEEATVAATARKPPPQQQQQPQPAPQLTLRNNAAPAASRVRTTRTPAAVSAFAATSRDPSQPVLNVKPLLAGSAAAGNGENDATGMSSDLSARMRTMLAFGAHTQQQLQQQQQEGQSKAPQNFPLRQPLGTHSSISNNAHHAREAAAALALSSGSPAAGAALPAPSAPARILKPAPAALGSSMLLVSKLTRRRNKDDRTAEEREGEEEDAAARSYRRTWFDVKMAPAAGPSRAQIIAERQRELAEAIHRQRLETQQARAAAAEGGDAAAEIAQFGGSYTSAARMHQRAKRSDGQQQRPQPTRNKSFARERSIMAARAQTAAATASRTPVTQAAPAPATTRMQAQHSGHAADILVVEH